MSDRAGNQTGRASTSAAQVRRTAFVTSVMLVVLTMAAACGSSNNPVVANIIPTTSPDTASTGTSPTAPATAGPQGNAVAYSACMRSHNVPNFPDPNPSGVIPKLSTQQLGVSDAQFSRHSRTAGASCRTVAVDQVPPSRSKRRRKRSNSPSVYAPTASRTSLIRTAPAAYPTLLPSESIKAPQNFRPQTTPARRTGHPTSHPMRTTTPGSVHTVEHDGALSHLPAGTAGLNASTKSGRGNES